MNNTFLRSHLPDVVKPIDEQCPDVNTKQYESFPTPWRVRMDDAKCYFCLWKKGHDIVCLKCTANISKSVSQDRQCHVCFFRNTPSIWLRWCVLICCLRSYGNVIDYPSSCTLPQLDIFCTVDYWCVNGREQSRNRVLNSVTAVWRVPYFGQEDTMICHWGASQIVSHSDTSVSPRPVCALWFCALGV